MSNYWEKKTYMFKYFNLLNIISSSFQSKLDLIIGIKSVRLLFCETKLISRTDPERLALSLSK
jgi:hypothetical protein